METKIKLWQTGKLIEQAPGIQGMYEQIEQCGRICYRSIPKGGKSAESFAQAMVSSGHHAMLEHGTVYLTMPVNSPTDEPHPIVYNKYTKAHRVFKPFHDGRGMDYITTNYRVLIENGWTDLLQYWSEPDEMHFRRLSILFDTSIGISREFNRHRVNSMAESSTRYCNYTKDKFGGAISVIEPNWLRDRAAVVAMTVKNKTLKDCCEEIYLERDKEWEKLDYWLFAMETANYCYQKLIELGCKPQEAREVLPLSTNTQLVHTAFIDDWKHFLELRAQDTPTNHPHPMAKEIASQVQASLQGAGYIR